MNQHLQSILNLIQQGETLTAEQKTAVLKSLKDADKELEITAFKLDRTEKVKRTTAILLEETIEELEQKRKAVEAQNRELEIETALERVRTVAMAMRTAADLLDICKIVYTELQSLGFSELRNAMINIHNDDKAFLLNYDYSDNTGKTVTNIPYNFHPLVEKQVMVTKNAQDAFFEFSFTGDELKQFRELRKNNGEQDDPKLEITDALHYYFYSIGTGSIGISTYSPISEEKLKLLKRFRNVFILSYQRYTDIRQAEAQARESQIQLALERVRARTMAMQRSDELRETSSLLFKQVSELGIKSWSAGFNIWDSDGLFLTDWMTSPAGGFLDPYKIPLNEFWLWKESSAAKQRGEEFLEIRLEGEKLKEGFTYLSNLPDAKEKAIFQSISLAGFQFPECVVNNYAFFSQGSLLFVTYEPVPEAHDIFKRFAKVFEQTYTRFLDLQKAEAQAREAKIEAALEKVRSRSLAMHKSDELNEVVTILFEKIKELQIPVTAVGIGIYIEGSKDMNTYVCGENEDRLVINNYCLPYFHHKIWKDLNNAREKQLDFFSGNYSKEEKDSFYKYVFEHAAELRHLPDDIKSLIFESPAYTISMAGVNHSMFMINDFEGKILSENDVDIIKRFARVFDQAYTRFLDLKKAEEQAREAKIEAALERTRTQSMIMQHSKELDDVLRVFHEQVLLLGIHSAFSFLWLPDEKNDRHIFWAAWGEDKNGSTVFKSKAINYPLDRSEPATAQCLVDWKGNEPIVSYHVPPAGVESYFAAWQELIDGVEQLKPEYFSGGLYYVEAFMKYGCFGVMVANDLAEDEKKILGRFAIEFERTYTRFLDLQKAEGQVREAQIELALERVRARTMAMQKSDELADAARLLYAEFKTLNINTYLCGYCFIKEEQDKQTVWVTTPDGAIIPDFIDFPLTGDPVLDKRYADWKQKKPLHVLQIQGEENKEFHRYLASKVADQTANEIFTQIPDRIIFYCANFSAGYLFIIANESLNPEDEEVIIRFARVFEQTYTRFLDLQKAEAQAREAQIELGLERVRARAMAMQKSDELSELVDTVFKELTKLDFALTWCIINIIDESSMSNTVWAANPDINKAPESYHMLFEDYPFHDAMMKGWKERRTKYVYTLEGSEKKIYDDYLFSETEFRRTPEAAQAASRAMEKYVVSFSFSNFGGLQTVGNVPLSDASLDILSRFGKVFDLTYTRFNDLTQAEAQARESQIQLALERVRARTMAMQKSDELPDAALLLSTQVKELGVQLWSTSFQPWDNDKKAVTAWTALKDIMLEPIKIPATEDSLMINISNAAKKGELLYVEEMGGKVLENHLKYMNSLPGVKEEFGKVVAAGFSFPTFNIFHAAYFSTGFILFITEKPYPEAHDIFKRFAAVFEQTYTRFLDLKKAEEQARESQIQLALERVRARTMAMQRSDELSETVFILFQQFKQLGENPDQATIGIINEDEWVIEYWVTMYGNQTNRVYKFPIDEPNVTNKIYKGWKEQKKSLVIDLSGKELYDFATFRESMGGAAYNENEKKRVINVAFFSKGLINVQSNESRSAESIRLLERFAGVFEQTYTRFLDLQKAEAQAREAQIEAALERVRSRSMGMQKSEELKEVIQVVYEQFVHLNIKVEHTGFVIDYKARDDYNIWIADPLGVPSQVTVPYFDSVYYNRFNEAKEKGEDFFATNLSFEEKNRFYQKLFEYVPGLPEEAKEFYFSCPGLAGSTVLLDNVCLYIENFSGIPYSDEENATLMRFGKVFQQTYTRFLDLQKAETQAREAKIEAGLERVRYSAMAMQSSEDVGAATAVVFHEIALLGVETMRCCITILHPDMTADVWAATATNEGKDMKGRGSINFNDHPLWVGLFDAWKNKAESFSFELKGDDLKTYYKALANSPNYDSSYIQNQEFPNHFLYASFFEQGAVFTFSLRQHDDYKRNIIKRFTAVFSLTFRRYLDLKKAEAQALEAIKRASVDRVRAEIASMRTTTDLEKITPLVWNELTTLSVPFIRCGVFIMDEEQQLIHTFLSTPEGKAIATLHVPFQFDLSIITNGLSHWRGKEMYKEYWDATAFARSWMALSSLRETSGDSHQHEQPPENLYLHLLPFLQGMLYVGNDTPLNEGELQLVQNLADAFSTAYARYEDFNKLESAKKQVDSTLNELQATQKQLIQSEKMASLGELTAGIAHEIQNPLNFVNNFSDVNTELIEELKGEWQKVNGEKISGLAEELFTDIVENEKKINHHGKRADAIVKGMLQHSRSSSGVKEPTNINALADEYLRLAYHGLRAKDKSFNATLKTEYDETIGKINIIPQDIGRVILNLINNAFYAVDEKKKQSSKGYEPTVSLSTKKTGGKVEIKVSDNGNGIPQKVMDKIFQPFFTTKPTGKGTGLGLSLAYDIVKAHGGELQVNCEEGKFTEFVITLLQKSLV